MKLNKNFVQISITALITSAVFIVPMAYSGTGLFNSGLFESTRITWSEATAMKDEYLNFRPLRVQTPENDNHGLRQNLEGFTIKASQLQEILSSNLSGGGPPDAVYFQFGQEGKFGDDFLGGLFHDSGNIRLIAVGVRNGLLLNTNTDGTTTISVYDKADPCPPNCPK